jgi:hypothetical protein
MEKRRFLQLAAPAAGPETPDGTGEPLAGLPRLNFRM